MTLKRVCFLDSFLFSHRLNSPQGPHHHVNCNSCGLPIVGLRYKCVVCIEYDLCEKCEATTNHPIDHPLMKIRVPVPPTFQGIHAVSAGLHQCRGHLSRVLVQSGPELYQGAELAKQNLAILKDQFASQIQALSEQLLLGANQLKDVVFEKYEEVKSSEFVGEVMRGTTTVFNAGMQQAQQRIQQFVQPANIPPTSSTPPQQPTPVNPQPEQKPASPSSQDQYKDALQTLSEMGFCDSQKNLEVVQRHNGNIDLCLQELL